MPGIRKQPRVVRASKLVAWFRFLNAYRDGKITVGHLEDMLLKAAERKQFRESKLSEAIVEDSSDDDSPVGDHIKRTSQPTTTEEPAAAIKRVQHPRLGWTEANAALVQEVVQREHARTIFRSVSSSPDLSIDKMQERLGQIEGTFENINDCVARLEKLEESLVREGKRGNRYIR